MDEQTRASRGRFLGTVGAAGVAGAALAGGAWRTSKAAGAAAADRTFVSGRFLLELEGKEAGPLRSAEGGDAVGVVVHEVGSASYYQKKHIGNVKYEDFTAEFGMGMSKDLHDWISETLTGQQTRKNGAVVFADFDYAVTSRREFLGARITEVGFPALDASSKEGAGITIRLAPERTVDKPASGRFPIDSKKQKLWSPANFRLDIKGLPTGKVSKVDAITIKQSAVTADSGERLPQREPGKLEFPNLVVTFPESDVQPWLDWHEDFVINGKNGEDKEKTGSLTFLDSTRKRALLELELSGLGIFKVAPDRTEAGRDAIKRIKAEMYCERIAVAFLGGPDA